MAEIFIKTPRGFRWPFSKGLVVESLMNLGVKVDAASALAHTIEEKLRLRKRLEVSAAHLKKILTQEVEAQLGSEVAEKLSKQTQTFEDIMVIEGRSRRPFSKGILARSLEGAGFSLDEGYEVAKDVEAGLRREGFRHIVAADLERRVGRAIERRFGRAARRRYSGRIQLMGEIFVEEAPGEPRVPFSKGVMAQSIMSVGISPDQAYRLSRDLENQLREEGRRVVLRSELRQQVERILQINAGAELAQRYSLLRNIRRTERPVHLLIGGVTGAGKSLLASALGYRLGITRLISTDVIREILRSTFPRDLIPTLHTSTFDAWSALAVDLPPNKEPEANLVLQGFRDQVSRIAVGLRALQERSAKERTSMVLEGVHVVPGFLGHPSQGDVIQVPLLLVVEDEEIHQGRFTLRERETLGSRPKGVYLRRFQDIRLIQNHLQGLALEAGIPVISTENLDRAIEQALEEIVSRVRQELHPH